MGGWADGRMCGWAAGRMGGWAGGRKGGWVDGRMGGWADGRMGGWADGRMGGYWIVIASVYGCLLPRLVAGLSHGLPRKALGAGLPQQTPPPQPEPLTLAAIC